MILALLLLVELWAVLTLLITALDAIFHHRARLRATLARALRRMGCRLGCHREALRVRPSALVEAALLDRVCLDCGRTARVGTVWTGVSNRRRGTAA